MKLLVVLTGTANLCPEASHAAKATAAQTSHKDPVGMHTIFLCNELVLDVPPLYVGPTFFPECL
jgi:hypothetical protein